MPSHAQPHYTLAAIHKIFNDCVLHTHARTRGRTDRRTDGQTPAAADAYDENYNETDGQH